MTCSIGSQTTSAMRLRMTSGRETWNSYPSRRIVSIRIPRCNSPLPLTLKTSGESVNSTRRLTFERNSLANRSPRCRVVTYLPSSPANGELFTIKFIESVGSSIATKGSGVGSDASAMVSPISTSSIPATAMISPVPASSTSMRFSPWNVYIFVTRASSTNPSRWTIFIGPPRRILPRDTRPMPRRPR